MSKIETVKIENEHFEGGFQVISAEDFNPDLHTKYEESNPDRDALFAEAVALGLKPHHNAGIPKIEAMIAETKESKV